MGEDSSLAFSDNHTMPVRFFYRLPPLVKMHYEELYSIMLPHNDMFYINYHKRRCDDLMYELSPKKFKWIQTKMDDETYFYFLGYYDILQPTIETIIVANDLYTGYPEYLI